MIAQELEKVGLIEQAAQEADAVNAKKNKAQKELAEIQDKIKSISIKVMR